MSFNELIYSSEITLGTAAIRLAFGFFAGFLIGIEREANNQLAGMRTHILISLGATLAMLLSIYIPQSLPHMNSDPARIAAQVVSGIGFLGAGAIIRFGMNVRGLTTAASVWSIAMIGMAIGAGMFKVGFIALGIIFFSLTVMDVFEKRLFTHWVFKRIDITAAKNSVTVTTFEKMLQDMKIRVHSSGVSKQAGDATEIFTFHVYISQKTDTDLLAGNIEKTGGVTGYSIKLVN